MEKKDLMIGDWVLLTDGPARVISIAQDGIYFEDKFGEGICSFDKIQPIPLTAEILEKNGFRNIGGHWYDDAADYYELEIEAYSDSIWRVIYHNTESNIGDERVFVSHIHELQHTLRLFGIEKEIEL